MTAPDVAVAIRRATAGDCAAIAAMVRTLARDTGASTVPKVTAAALAARAFGPAPLLHLWIAEAGAEPVGTLVGVETFSTWRGTAGLYVCDLHVEAAYRSRRIGEALLAAAARDALAAGLGFLKLETTAENAAVGRFYARLGFAAAEGETAWALEAEGMARLSTGA